MFYVILGVVAWVCLAFWPASIAKKKGYNFALFFLASIIISWIITLIIAVTLKDKTMTAQDIADEKAVDKILEAEENQ